jgi:hypothetical protein
MRTAVAILILATVAAAGDSRNDVERKLEAKISIHLRQARLSDGLDIFRSATGLNFVIEQGADRAISFVVTDLSAKSALRLLLAPLDLTAVFENGAVVIRNRQSLASGAVLRIYDVRATLVRVQDFPSPGMGLAGSFGVVFG